MNLDIVSVVRDALFEIGCADKVDDGLNPHSPIHINFRDGSEIRIDASDDIVTLIAPMPPVSEPILQNVATQLLTFVMREPSALFTPNRPVLLWYESHLSLEATLATNARAMPAFRYALEQFFEETRALMQIIGR